MLRYLVLLFLFKVFYSSRAEQKESVYVRNYELTFFHGGDDKLTHGQAMTACSIWRPGAHLVMIKDEQIQEGVDDLLEAWAFPNTWLGGSDYMHEGVWKWVDGTYLEDGYTNWEPGQPSPTWNAGWMDCLAHWNRTWNDKRCSEDLAYICQIDTSKVTVSSYSDVTFSFTTVKSDSEEPKNFTEAKKYCEKSGSRLVKPEDEKLFENIRSNIKKQTNETDMKCWIDVDNTPDGKCIAISENGWEENNCNETLHYACEKFFPSNVKVSDVNPAITESQDLQVECIASGLPVPEMSWHYNTVEITDDDTRRIHQVKSDGKSVLVIKNADLDDSGKYQCFASNKLKRSARTFAIVEVYEKDFDLSSLKTDTIYGGSQGFKSLNKFYHRDSKERRNSEALRQNSPMLEKELFGIPCSSWILPAGIALAALWALLITLILIKCFHDKNAVKKSP